MSTRGKTRKGKARRERTPFEWAILATSVAAIIAMVGALIASGVRATEGPPDLRTSVTLVGPRSGGVAYEVQVRNIGGETAENLEIEVTVGSETRALQLTAVARSDDERGIVVFPPGTQGAARVEVQSYSETAR